MNKRRKNLIRMLLKHPVQVAKKFDGFNWLGDLHNQWIKEFVYGSSEYTLLAHRESYKTTAVSFSLALIALLFPDQSTLFVRKTDTDVKEVKKSVENLLSSKLFKEFSKILYGIPLHLTVNSAGEINTNLKTTSRGTSQLVFLGIHTSVTGKHFERIFTDDIVSKLDRISKPEREKTIYDFMELRNLLNRGGRLINTCTPWHKEDCIQTRMNNRHYFDCYSTGLMTKEQIQAKKDGLTESLFSANYELKHITDVNALFKDAKFENDGNLLLDCIGHIDAGYGGEDATGFTLLKLLSDGRIIALGKRFQKHVDYCLPEIKAYCEKYRCGTIWCEDNGDKGYLAEKMRKEYGLRAKTYHENQNKYDKICTHLHNAWKNIYFIGTDEDYINEILDYNEYSTKDDCVDSIASLIRQVAKRPSVEFLR